MAQPLPALPILETPLPAIDEDARLSALERLYTRRDTVDDLILSLELYLSVKGACRGPAVCVPINASPKWSS